MPDPRIQCLLPFEIAQVIYDWFFLLFPACELVCHLCKIEWQKVQAYVVEVCFSGSTYRAVDFCKIKTVIALLRTILFLLIVWIYDFYDKSMTHGSINILTVKSSQVKCYVCNFLVASKASFAAVCVSELLSAEGVPVHSWGYAHSVSCTQAAEAVKRVTQGCRQSWNILRGWPQVMWGNVCVFGCIAQAACNLPFFQSYWLFWELAVGSKATPRHHAPNANHFRKGNMHLACARLKDCSDEQCQQLAFSSNFLFPHSWGIAAPLPSPWGALSFLGPDVRTCILCHLGRML